ncbi:Nucleoside diphosphate-linked moiety X motif, putative [Pediculus humanus corporis]|uniref:Nucleoside diphosphate-linked moiety X motif, putative n=1 Tax=Pediculus humanus subsp. corporis TaxID=121224 RepID=E0VAL3_PEDHC|nr:Nucleoside diphosphate-linked moiety X motif, putative [Pediculus humanus corporis]EEB10419.1 Nucleoside diphosphate-linked moiety X motif, putative [Pediculus humanus corporis]
MYEEISNWGEIINKTLNQGREDKSSEYKKINPGDKRYTEFVHCSHVMIYSKTNSLFENFEKKAIILVSFPGGIVDKGETPLSALHRELKEELNWNENDGSILESDIMFAHVDEKNERVYHFYATEVTEEKMLEIESKMNKACDYGNEVLGTFRIPLYIMGDAFRGFPSEFQTSIN